MTTRVKLGYWRIRGRAQVCRLLLAYTGAVWEDVQYTQPEQWFALDKKQLALDFPDLPYIIQGGFNVTQSPAVIEYIIDRSQKKQLLGKTPQDKAKINSILGVVRGCGDVAGKLIFDKDFQPKRPEAWKSIEAKIQNLQKFRKNNSWMLDYLTLADFLIAQFSYYIENVFPEEFKKYQFLSQIRNNFNDLPEIKKYYEQESSVKGPFMPQSAVIKF